MLSIAQICGKIYPQLNTTVGYTCRVYLWGNNVQVIDSPAKVKLYLLPRCRTSPNARPTVTVEHFFDVKIALIFLRLPIQVKANGGLFGAVVCFLATTFLMSLEMCAVELF